ncbi:alanine--tRNA ligase [archaeon]|jgi:alanyl-tRNA synthetase|nr:alanine--tRNA ligase [archaeon]
MLPDKVIKEKYKPIFWKNPEKFYAVKVLKEEGFSRFKCKECGKPFWSIKKRTFCGDPVCSGESVSFIGKKSGMSYVDLWLKFQKMFAKFGYTSIKRYPVVSRWNPTMEYTNASIAAFQPFVISGEVEPPAEKLVIPQFCLRFIDTDNVGITMSHFTGFVMIGQHLFSNEWDQDEMFRCMLEWNKNGLRIKNEDAVFHEDAWAGGGNVGCCMEMFSKGVEVWNQVYMLYEQTDDGVKELDKKVLDMGMGLERCAWYSQGTNTIYDATFPDVLEKLLNKTEYKIDKKLLKKFSPYGGVLNLDEVEDIDKAWKKVAKKVGVPVKELKEKMLPLSGIYSIAEHTRSLLLAIADGAMPSNVGGGYNLRMLVRRCFNFIDKYGWDVYLPEVCEWHAEELKKLFPLKKSLKTVRKILDIEKIKYDNTKARAKGIVAKLGKVGEKELLQLYDSQGISPEMVGVEVPDNFYAKIAELHEEREFKGKTLKKSVEIKGVEDSKALYFDDYKKVSFSAEVIFVKGDNVVLDKTAFYPTSGGQLHDIGELNGKKVEDVWKQGGLIVHKVKGLKKGKVKGKIDLERRKRLAVHHTATHVVNAAAKKVLGSHVNQAGAFKDVDKARLDITHYDNVSNEELVKIEEEANKIVKSSIDVVSEFIPRNVAEKKYGMEIYQGGAVPGKKLRIVSIKGIDVEACGGTHLNNTKEIKEIKILKSTKVQDGVIRLVFVAGDAAVKVEKEDKGVLKELAKELGCGEYEVVGRARELFKLWKDVVKKKRDVEKKLISKEKFDGDVLLETCKVLKTQPEHVLKTVKRFKKELGI